MMTNIVAVWESDFTSGFYSRHKGGELTINLINDRFLDFELCDLENMKDL